MQVMMSMVVWEMSLPCSVLLLPPKPTRAEDTPPRVTAMPIHERYVRSRAACVDLISSENNAKNGTRTAPTEVALGLDAKGDLAGLL